MTIKQRQHLLAYLGYYTGNIDGDWGPLSGQATEAFQRDYQLTVDGIFGDATARRIREVIYNQEEPTISKATEDSSVAPDWWEEIEYFDPPEIACKCGLYHDPYCNGYPHQMQRLTMQIADRARKHFGKPITVISGLRCRQHNADSKGHVNSQHMYGEALDLYVQGESQQTVLNWFLSQSDVRYAYAIQGSSNVHFDIQPVGR